MARTAMAVVREKQVRAVRMARAGRSYEDIASELGYAHRSSAWRLVRGGLDRLVADSAEEYLLLETDRLDRVQAAYWEDALHGDLAAAHVVLRVIDLRARLLGLHRQPLGSKGPCALLCPALAREYWQPGYATD